MSRPRWWETNEASIESEMRAFRDAGLAFELDDALRDHDGVIVFRGELRLDERRIPAEVRYPPSYVDGEPVVVVSDALPIGRHRSLDGVLCLDHAVLGQARAMNGAEAILRAERLWWLWENDRDALAAEEADAPDPRANYYAHDAGSAVAVTDPDVTNTTGGWLSISLLSLDPFRGGVSRITDSSPEPREIPLDQQSVVLGGGLVVGGFWSRVDPTPAGMSAGDVHEWATANHPDLVERAMAFAAADRIARPRFQVPAVLGYVYRDEGPGRGEYHDAWLFLIIHPDGRMQLPRPFVLRKEERWLRQPQLEPLGAKKVGIVGLGALGSPMAALLARAGVGKFVLIDHDVVTPGNRVRHDLDLADLGQWKVEAVGRRLRRINPWLGAHDVSWVTARYGGAINGRAEDTQRVDDQIADVLSTCDLIVNATAHTSTGYHCARLGRATGTPVLHVWASAGAWGARIILQDTTGGCPLCLAYGQEESNGDARRIPNLSEDPLPTAVLERGCADPSFTGPGFELTESAAAASRIAVQSLSNDTGYPTQDFNIATLTFRDETAGRTTPVYTHLPVHPNCTICNSA